MINKKGGQNPEVRRSEYYLRIKENFEEQKEFLENLKNEDLLKLEDQMLKMNTYEQKKMDEYSSY